MCTGNNASEGHTIPSFPQNDSFWDCLTPAASVIPDICKCCLLLFATKKDPLLDLSSAKIRVRQQASMQGSPAPCDQVAINPQHFSLFPAAAAATAPTREIPLHRRLHQSVPAGWPSSSCFQLHQKYSEIYSLEDSEKYSKT